MPIRPYGTAKARELSGPVGCERKLDRVSLESNTIRKAISITAPLQLQLPIEGEDMLGYFACRNAAINPFDLDLLAWITERWRLENEMDANGRVSFSMYRLAHDLWDRDRNTANMGSFEYQRLKASLRRLYRAEFQLAIWDRKTESSQRADEKPNLEGWVRLIAELWIEQGEQVQVQLGGWLCDQVRAGSVTYLSWSAMRGLDGAAKLLWLYLESQKFKRVQEGVGEYRLWLNDPAWASLGIIASRAVDRRRTLAGACERVQCVDSSYTQLRLVRPRVRGGVWALKAQRCNKQARERLAVRRQIQASLPQTTQTA